MTKKLLFFFSLFFLTFATATNAAQPSLIRDAETERFLRQLARPIFIAANLNPNNISIYIVNDDSLNAFVSGGQNVFINTGLIRKYSTPDTLIGVIAHESGHIAAGHLARSSEGAESAQGAMLLSYLLGIGAALGGSPDAGIALILGGSESANRLFMKYTRGQEEAADNHAIEYLSKMQYPADGLVELLEFFESEMVGYQGQIDEYLLSHPVSKKRIDLIKNKTSGVKFSDKKINKDLQPEMNQVLAKLEGFMENPNAILKKYQKQNDELSNYKKSIAFFRKGEIKKSLQLLEKIILDRQLVIRRLMLRQAQHDNNSQPVTLSLSKGELSKGELSKYDTSELGFLYELKGQILFESGQIYESVLAYDKSLKLLPEEDAAQAKIAFAAAIIGLPKSDKDLLKLAIKKLEEAKKYEAENPFLFRQLASAYSKIDDEGRSILALAQFNCMIGEKEKCQKYAKEAKEKLEKNAKTELLQADDLLESVKDDVKKENEGKNNIF